MKSNPRLNPESILSQRTLQLLHDAQQLLANGKLTSSRLAVNKILRKEPKQTDALIIRYQIEAAEGQFDTALDLLIGLVDEHDLSERQLMTLAGHLNKLELYFLLNKVLDKLIALHPQDMKIKYNQSLCLSKIGQIQAAIELALVCEQNNFADPLLLLNLGHNYKAFGDTPKAAEYYRKYINQDPANSGYGYWGLADLKNYVFRSQEIEDMQDKLAKIAQGQPENKPELIEFALSHAMAQQKSYSQALQFMTAANAKLSQLRPFKQHGYLQLINELSHYTPVSQNIEVLTRESVTPIFIVGMPRSGTTLTEQILASHSQVAATDELPYIERIAMQLSRKQGYSQSLLNMTDEQRLRYSGFYLKQAKAYLTEEHPYIIDKNPTNYLHIALILALFPNAKIINLIRDPFDNAMSVYRQHFSHGNDFSFNLAAIESYVSGYVKIMGHWSKQFPEKIYHLDYAKLVSEPQKNITELLEFCGLPVENACFEFFKSDKPVLTPSASQVRQPIHKNALGSADAYAQYLPQFKQQMDSLKALIQSTLR
ncbi:tetratricopeptide repeat-containing sulfotransferase family protein [Aliiglaciecola lipolytica]|uniref:tetratricopeptide repeat-containing sulfotransferase family protein n=1 Tax=Aliiglaciecola lipolytica TaxID=477689 RepID=UPI001C091D41|nr:sulfotransferase [Aliiglaciecola lipolytica]MBU2879860.1 sulfotransferase [Aliiglaciecola lipolytica]